LKILRVNFSLCYVDGDYEQYHAVEEVSEELASLDRCYAPYINAGFCFFAGVVFSANLSLNANFDIADHRSWLFPLS
jgi:hypothetical protein